MSEVKIKLCAIIPVYNHPERLHHLVMQLSELNLPLLMVDDGSGTECRQLLQQLEQENTNVALYTHLSNQGKGAAIKSGMFAALKAGFTHTMQIDADGQHDLDDIPHFITAMSQQPDALIAGYPLFDKTIPKSRYYGRYASHIWVWINTLSMVIKDSMCGFRIYPVAQSCQLINRNKMGNRMEFDGEFIVHWYWSDQPLVKIPTRVIYHTHGVSHFRLFKDNFLISCMHARLFLGMLLRLPGLLKRKRKKL